ncbi:helix-turn-helix domain-containing protein [Chryseobacterium sp. SORGH_AS_0447]|uniref:helix-turn-helix domain-containing protein n=1 Tax=Chryseobacterium sp. SORGH_AS_0447 TaxID=3041769 RepID=UPI0027D7BD0F|nr:helix-turn-helix domain-containing protein [Chryseobacterium sp. SORGH_AS_0447]
MKLLKMCRAFAASRPLRKLPFIPCLSLTSQSLIKNDLSLNNLLLDVFAERIVNTSSRASYQQLHTTEHTLSQLLEVKSREMEISKEDMAAYLGITVRSLNRALKELQENNSEE